MEQKRAGCFTVLIGGLLIGAVLDRCSTKHSEPPAIASTPAAPVSTPTPAAPELTPEQQATQAEREAREALDNPRYAIGQEFSVGYFSYVVNKVEVKPDESRGPLVAVDITIRNNDSSDTMTPSLSLLDEYGKKRAGAILALAAPSGDLLTELRPGVVYRGYAAFNGVPTDARYILLVSGGLGLAPEKSAIVPLFEQPAAPPSTTESEQPAYKWIYEKTDHGWVSRKELVPNKPTDSPGPSSEVTPGSSPQPLSAQKRQLVIDLRQHVLEKIEAIERILSASSFAARTEAYCRFYVDQSPSMVPGISSEKQAEERYAELLRYEPPTREEELRRQYQMRAIHDRMAAFAQEVSTCRGLITTGAQTIPGEDALRKYLADERLAISKADSLLANH